jgi:hypothetical protein
MEARLAKRAARPQLTPREVEVIDLVAQATRNKETHRTSSKAPIARMRIFAGRNLRLPIWSGSI